MRLLTRAIVAATATALVSAGAAVAAPAGSGDSVNSPVRDDRYPQYGSTLVDSLHYHLGLSWYPASQRLVGHEYLRFRATRDASSFSLDLASPLHVTSATVDGRRVTTTHKGHKITFASPVTQDSRHDLRITYSGKPHPTRLWSTRVEGYMDLGWLQNKAHEAYAEQEPYGAFTWYAVNDQPSDKATYSFTISAPRTWVGVANGKLLSRKVRHDRTITRWSLDTPASSYLTTIGIGPYRETVDHSIKGFPITYWVPRGKKHDWILKKLRYTPTALTWLEKRLGAYPFSSLGILAAPEGGMETQTMVTLGRDAYTDSRDVIVHELAHQWFGDEVSPLRWDDVWLNEGWAMYLAEVTWSSHGSAATRNDILSGFDDVAADFRRSEGPPAKSFPRSTLDNNVYMIPALMWDMVRQKLGDQLFWKLAKEWPATHRFGNASYQTSADWWSEQSGVDLHPLFQAWLLDKKEPAWTPPTDSDALRPVPVPTRLP